MKTLTYEHHCTVLLIRSMIPRTVSFCYILQYTLVSNQIRTMVDTQAPLHLRFQCVDIQFIFSKAHLLSIRSPSCSPAGARFTLCPSHPPWNWKHHHLSSSREGQFDYGRISTWTHQARRFVSIQAISVAWVVLGQSVYWQKIFEATPDPTFVLLISLWHARMKLLRICTLTSISWWASLVSVYGWKVILDRD